MSVKELKLKDYPWSISITAGEEKLIFKLKSDLPNTGAIIALDRNQANLLMLYLQELLK